MHVKKFLAQAEALLAARRPLEAAACFDHAERLGADQDLCCGRRWTCYMLAGEYERAWQESDAIRTRGAPDEHRVWDGQPLAGRHVMVRSVHGFGDAIQMLRYTSLMRSQAARLTVQVAPELVELVRCAADVDEVIAWGEERPYDAQLEITELPYLFRSTLRTLPAATPYLQLAAASVKEACSILGERAAPRVGLVWSSSAWDKTRSIPLSLFRPLLDARKDCEFWCLQPDSAEWHQLSKDRGCAALHAGDYSAATFAACIAQMDLVIAVDSFAAHLAGALGRPAWVLLKQQADWRWMIDREDSPWYPTLRLFRQQQEGNWQQVLAEAAHQLAAWRESTEQGQRPHTLSFERSA